MASDARIERAARAMFVRRSGTDGLDRELIDKAWGDLPGAHQDLLRDDARVVLDAAGPSEDEARLARERDEARHEAAMNGEAIMLAREAMGAEGGIAFFDDAVRAVVKQRDEARAAAEKLQAVIDKACAALIGSQHVGSPPEREVWRAVCDLLMSLRTKYTADGALSGGGGQ